MLFINVLIFLYEVNSYEFMIRICTTLTSLHKLLSLTTLLEILKDSKER